MTPHCLSGFGQIIRKIEHRFIQKREPCRKGPVYVEEQYDTDAIGVIPHFVLVRVVKNYTLTSSQ
jgi:hypothetical protein